MARLLVSVRSAEEAEFAVAGGAEIIDVKEPARGAMGRADLSALRAVVAAVAGRRPVSAALGELIEWNDRQAAEYPLPEGLAYVKVGLTACDRRDWRAELLALREKMNGYALAPLKPPAWIAVAYADQAWARSPAPMEVATFAGLQGFAGVLLDTWEKSENRLSDWMTDAELARFVAECRTAELTVALAGSLRAGDIQRWGTIGPDVFAVRGAACREGDRGEAIDVEAVKQLAAVVAGAARVKDEGGRRKEEG
jgi:hypothetical protein